jgi:GAF domain-containing protein/HAMP domain-containing protein
MTTAAPASRAPRATSLSRRFTLTLLPLVVIPLLVMAVAAYVRSQDVLRGLVNAQLSTAARGQFNTLSDWAAAREERLQLGSQRTSLRAAARRVQLAPTSEAAKVAVRAELVDLVAREGSVLFSELMIVQREDFRILASTRPEFEGQPFLALQEDRVPPESLATTPLYDDAQLAPGNLAVVVTAPMHVLDQPAVDTVLVGVNSDLRLGSLMEEMQVFWEQRGIYRVEEGNTFIALAPDIIVRLERYSMVPTVQTGVVHPVFRLAQTTSSGVLNYDSFDAVPVVGAYEWSPEWDMGVVLELPQSIVFAGLASLGPFTLTLLIGAIALAVLVVPWATRRSLAPLRTLTEFAERFASGDLQYRVPLERRDEIGRLAEAFNNMARDLSMLYRSLEERVELRTRQIRTAAEVARDAAVIRNADDLLDATVNLISARFGHYHAAVFLVDEKGEEASLRAASSPGGKRMLARGHKLAVGKVGLVGFVTGTGKPRIALDVGADATHFANPDLPKTRSELALPLRAGERVIGALDVQSTEPNAFDENDVVVLQTMADQVAIALENARLLQFYTRQSVTRRAVIEVYSKLAQGQTFDAVLRSVTDEISRAFDYTSVALALVEGDDIIVRSLSDPAGESRLQLGESVGRGQGVLGRAAVEPIPVVDRDAEADPPRLTLGVSLVARGQTVGALAVSRADTGEPAEADLEVLQQMATPLAATIENARLFEATQQSLQQLDSLYRQQTGQAWEQLVRSRARGAPEGTFDSDVAVPKGSTTIRAPIELRGETIGSLDILGQHGTALGQEDQAILHAVADELAGALEQARLMEEIHRRAVQLQTAAEIARDATGQLDLPTMLRRAVDLIRDRFGYDHVAIYLLDEAQRRATLREAGGTAAEDLKRSGHALDADATSIVGYVVRSGQSYLANDVVNDAYYSAHPLLLETRSELAVPLRVGEVVIGALDVRVSRPFAFTQDDVTVLEILADQVAVGMQNARLYQSTLQRAQREQAVVDVTSRIRSSQSIDEILRTAVREMRRALGAQRALIWLNPAPALTPAEGTTTPPATPGNGGNGDGAGATAPAEEKV